MQTSSKTTFWHLVLLSLATLFIVFGCMDTEDSNIYYPEGHSYEAFNIKDVQGSIKMTNGKWAFVPDGYRQFHKSDLGIEETMDVLIHNMKESYKQYTNKKVKVSGHARFLHAIRSANYAAGSTYVYTIDIKDIAEEKPN